MTSEKTLGTLEYPKILTEVAAYAYSVAAKNKILDLKPSTDYETIENSLTEVEEAWKTLYQYSISPSFSFDDVDVALSKAAVFSVLTEGELLRISRVLRVSRLIKSAITKVPDETIVRIKEIAESLYVNKQLEDDINDAILSETEISDNASVDLRHIRSKIRKTGERIKSELYRFVTSSQYKNLIQDSVVTIRNDRYVIPLKSECKGQIPGLIHDQSASGATFYVEPMIIVELNNELKTLLLEEAKEIERILREFTSRVASEEAFLRFTFEEVTRLDVIFAKAAYANAVKATRPVLNEKGRLKIERGRHPLIDKQRVIPISLELGRNFDMLLITGPNTGGKTVSLKLAGLYVLMAESGLFVPAEYAEIAIFKDVFADVGDEQSIEQNLSTFSSHIKNIVEIVKNAQEGSLVLLDELGAGTDPAEGASLALSVSDTILKSGAKSIITTHFNELKEYGVVTDGVENASMDFDPVSYAPTYRLILGTPGASNALMIAERLGMPQSIVEKAKNGLKHQKVEFENVLQKLEEARKAAIDHEEATKILKEEAEKRFLEAEKERLKLIQEREKLNEVARKKTKKLVEEAMEEANQIIEELRALLDEPDEQALFEARKLRKSLKKYVVEEENEFLDVDESDMKICVGDRVYVSKLNGEGEILNINPIKNEAKVKLGNITSNFKMCDLKRLKGKKEAEKPKAPRRALPVRPDVKTELMLVGKTTAEAEPLLLAFLDQAVLGGLKEIKIIHGVGTGILRKFVQNALKEDANVESIRDGIYGEGERGVTFALLKNE